MKKNLGELLVLSGPFFRHSPLVKDIESVVRDKDEAGYYK